MGIENENAKKKGENINTEGTEETFEVTEEA
jgi:hypothetical protein